MERLSFIEGPGVDTKKITIIHLSVTAGLVILMEWAAKRAGAGLHWPEYAWLGTVRILEATALISYFIWAGPGANAMGLGRNRLFPGVLTGLIWSLCFAAIAAAGLGVLYLSGVNALTLFRMPLPAVKFEVFLFFPGGMPPGTVCGGGTLSRHNIWFYPARRGMAGRFPVGCNFYPAPPLSRMVSNHPGRGGGNRFCRGL